MSMRHCSSRTSGYVAMVTSSDAPRNSKSGYEGAGTSTRSPRSHSSLKRYPYASLVLAVSTVREGSTWSPRSA